MNNAFNNLCEVSNSRKARKWAVAYSKPIVTFKDTKRTNELISNISNKRERKQGEFLQKVKREIEEQEK